MPYSQPAALCDNLDFLECHLAVTIWKVFAPAFLVVGICGNVLSIVVLSRKRMCVTTTSVYLRFLAVVDSLVLLIAVLRELISYYTAIDLRELSDLTCKVHLWLSYNGSGLSCWLLCIIAIDRLVAIRYPLWAKSHCTKRTAIVTGSILSVIVSLLDSHLLFSMYRDEVYVSSNASNITKLLEVTCSPSNVHYIKFYTQVWPVLTFILYSLLPIICLIVCNIVLIKQLSLRSLRKQSRRKTDVGLKRERRDLRSLTKMLIVVCVVFIIVTVPTCIYLIISPYLFARTSPRGIATRLLLWAIVAFFLYSNHTFNFIIYCVTGSLFRKELHDLFVQIKVNILKCFNRRIHPIQVENGTKAGPSCLDYTGDTTTAHVTEIHM